MPSQTSPSSSALKRKQQTISSFFSKKPEKAPSGEIITKPRTKVIPAKENDSAVSIQDKEVDDEEIVLPSRKRAKINGFSNRLENAAVSGQELQRIEDVPHSSGGRTERFRFSSPVEDSQQQESASWQRQRNAQHQKFVKKLGGADCIIGIGKRTATEDEAAPGPEDVDGEENEEPTSSVITKESTRSVVKKSVHRLTPMEKQVIEIKRKHMDTLLVIEVGYKFRFFGEDARIAARELSIVCIPGKLRFDERKFAPQNTIRECVRLITTK
jgi:DNA mismatch repair protein MSH3